MKRTKAFQPDNNEEDSDELFDKLMDKFLHDELDLDDVMPENESKSVDNDKDDDDDDLTDEELQKMFGVNVHHLISVSIASQVTHLPNIWLRAWPNQSILLITHLSILILRFPILMRRMISRS